MGYLKIFPRHLICTIYKYIYIFKQLLNLNHLISALQFVFVCYMQVINCLLNTAET